MNKSPFASKTLWINGLTIAGVVITALVNHELIMEHPGVMSAMTIALSGINMVLRFMTGQPITAGK